MTNRLRKTINECKGIDPQIVVETFFVVLDQNPEAAPTAEELAEFVTPDIGSRMI
jgi:hypothetical protein